MLVVHVEEDAEDGDAAGVVDYEGVLEVAQVELADLAILTAGDELGLLVGEVEVVYGRFVGDELFYDLLFVEVPHATRAVDTPTSQRFDPTAIPVEGGGWSDAVLFTTLTSVGAGEFRG